MTATIFNRPIRPFQILAMALLVGVCANRVQAQIGHVHIGPIGGGGFAGAGAVGGLGSSYDPIMPLSPLPDLNLGSGLSIQPLPQPLPDLGYGAPAVLDVQQSYGSQPVNSGYGNSGSDSWTPASSGMAAGSPPPSVDSTFIPPAPVASQDDDDRRITVAPQPPTASNPTTPKPAESSGKGWKFWLVVVAIVATLGSLFDR